MHIIESIAQHAGAMAALRRDLHAHPELRFEETRTADVVAQQLIEWGIPCFCCGTAAGRWWDCLAGV